MIKPHGSDTLNPLFVYDSAKHDELLHEAENLPSLEVNSAAAANAVMLGAGYFNPLTGYMNLADAISVAESMKTTDDLFWPTPVMNVTNNVGAIKGKKRIALRDPNVEGNPILAIMDLIIINLVTNNLGDLFSVRIPQNPLFAGSFYVLTFLIPFMYSLLVTKEIS